MGIRGLEFYSGIGGLCTGLERSRVDGQVVCAFEWDHTAASVYNANHGNAVQKVHGHWHWATTDYSVI